MLQFRLNSFILTLTSINRMLLSLNLFWLSKTWQLYRALSAQWIGKYSNIEKPKKCPLTQILLFLWLPAHRFTVATMRALWATFACTPALALSLSQHPPQVHVAWFIKQRIVSFSGRFLYISRLFWLTYYNVWWKEQQTSGLRWI